MQEKRLDKMTTKKVRMQLKCQESIRQAIAHENSITAKAA
jgi:hypothetical protein